MNPVRFAVLAGARPNFMKVAPLMRQLLRDPAFDPILIHTGQHYDQNMSGQFFAELGIAEPRYHLQAGSGSHAQQTAAIMMKLEPVLLETAPAAVIVVGDVNSTVAGALVASKLGIQVIHVEAGLRSGDRSMPEEINRVVTDSISDLLMVTEASGEENLLREGVPRSRIHIVGNLMIDTLRQNLDRARESDVVARLGAGERFGLVTLHRPANVDSPETLGPILSALNEISKELPLLWPMHPRTRGMLAGSSLEISPSIHTADPLGYLDFLCLQSRAEVVLTDSGGIQEETTALGVPCLTLRDNTERPITITSGTNRLAGTSRESILAAWREHKTSPKSGRVPPLWDGRAGERCTAVFRQVYSVPVPAASV